MEIAMLGSSYLARGIQAPSFSLKTPYAISTSDTGEVSVQFTNAGTSAAVTGKASPSVFDWMELILKHGSEVAKTAIATSNDSTAFAEANMRVASGERPPSRGLDVTTWITLGAIGIVGIVVVSSMRKGGKRRRR